MLGVNYFSVYRLIQRGNSTMPRNARHGLSCQLDEPVNAKIIHAEHIGGFLHGIRQSFGCGVVGCSSVFGMFSMCLPFHVGSDSDAKSCSLGNVFVDSFIHRALPINRGSR